MEMLSYYSLHKGIGGEVKSSSGDFIVEEISKDGVILELNKKIEQESKEGNFTHFILQKNNWTTSNAIKELSKKLKISQRSFNYAGTKDKVALTTQLCSVWKVEPISLLQLNIKDIKINGAWKAKEKISLGGLLGNRFRIKIRNIKEKNPKQAVYSTYEELHGVFPNYFGEQRFGSTRANTHKIGELLLKNRFKDAALLYLCDSVSEKNQEAVLSRKKLSEEMDFKKALQYFPRHLIHERTLLFKLSQNPNDYANALRALPRPILLLFVHAFQSYLFNLNLSERIKEGKIKKEEREYFCATNSYGFPDLGKKGKDWLSVKLIGHESKLNNREKKLLARFMVHQDDFKVKGLPEISAKGSYRTFFAPLKDFDFSNELFSFSLPSGSYATSALREFTKNN